MIFDALVKEKLQIAKDTWEITFEHNEDNFYFNAGQYVWIITPIGRRAFSISSTSSRTDTFQIIFRDRGGSEYKRYILENSGSNVQVRGAFGTMRIPPKDSKNIFMWCWYCSILEYCKESLRRWSC